MLGAICTLVRAMSTTTRSAEDDSTQISTPALKQSSSEPPELLIGTQVASDRCATCGAGLAPDQRYCVECGTRRGKPRFSPQPAKRSEPVTTAVVTRTHRAGWTSSTTLLAGIATLLLAIGVGFLIGHSESKAPKNGGIHVVVNGGGGTGSNSGAAASTSSTSSGNSGSASTSSGSKSSKSSSSKTGGGGRTGTNTKAKAVNAPPPASGVSKNVTSTPVVKPGGACKAGTPGCQGGKETGNFFGNS
jgi:hypothetical protein